MRNLTKIIGGLVVVAVSFGITLLLLQHFSGPGAYCKRDDLIALKPPFASFGGKGFVAYKQAPGGDSTQGPSISSLVLCEDQKRLGPSRSMHDDIRTMGRGRYSHWGPDVIFSTSDNSDPNTNGHRYSYVLR